LLHKFNDNHTVTKWLCWDHKMAWMVHATQRHQIHDC